MKISLEDAKTILSAIDRAESESCDTAAQYRLKQRIATHFGLGWDHNDEKHLAALELSEKKAAEFRSQMNRPRIAD